MFDLGWSELLVIAVLALIFVGPKDLPKLMQTVGRYVGKIRSMAREFQQSFEDMARETELEELRKEVDSLRSGVMQPLESPKPANTSPETVQAETAKPAPIDTEGLPEEMVEAIREAEALEAGPDPLDKPAPQTGKPDS